MATEGKEDAVENKTDINHQVNDLITLLQDENKIKRRKALESVESLCSNWLNGPEEGDLAVKFEPLLKPLINRLSDQAEKNRIFAADILLKFTNAANFTESHLAYIVPIFHNKLGQATVMEDSEDVRLLFMKIVLHLINIFNEKLTSYMSEIVDILKNVVVDVSPDVRKISCECVSIYAEITKTKFHMQSESLAKPLLKAMVHQRFKIRIAAINALGDILLCGDNQVIETVSGSLVQSVMDNPQVRLAVIKVGAKLARGMADRYSYWHRILPLVLSGLRDDDKDVKETAHDVWIEIGRQYEDENEDELKNEINFDTLPKYYPSGETRFGVGCRTLVTRNLHRLIPGLLTDLDDWQEAPRLQAIKLLTTLVLIAEVGIIQYLDQILTSLYAAAGEREEYFVKQVKICCECLGYFVTPETYINLIQSYMGSNASYEKPMTVLAAIIRGTPSHALDNAGSRITLALEQTMYTTNASCQAALVDIAMALMAKCQGCQSDSESRGRLFATLFYVRVSTPSDCIEDDAQTALEFLAEIGDQELDGLYSEHLLASLERVKGSAELWTENSPEYAVFLGLLELAGPALGSHLDFLLTILSNCLRSQKDALVCLHCFTKMQILLSRTDCPLDSNSQLQDWLPRFVTQCVYKFLPWHAGQTAESLRAAAVWCLVAVLRVGNNSAELEAAVAPCVDLLPALLQDESENSREASCEAIFWMATNFSLPFCNADRVFNLADKLIARFDDKVATVRHRAARVLPVLTTQVAPDYDVVLFSPRLQAMYGAAVIYLDDLDEQLRQDVFAALEQIGQLAPHLLQKTLEKDVGKYRNKDLCQQLIDKMQSLSVSSGV